MSKVKGLGVHFIAPGGRCLFTCLPVKLDIPKTKPWFGGLSLGTKRSIPQASPEKTSFRSIGMTGFQGRVRVKHSSGPNHTVNRMQVRKRQQWRSLCLKKCLFICRKFLCVSFRVIFMANQPTPAKRILPSENIDLDKTMFFCGKTNGFS